MKPSRMAANRAFKYDRAHTVNIAVDMAGLDDLLRELGDEVEAAVRPAAQAAAEVLYRAVLANVDAIGSVTGSLRSAIYQKFLEDQSGPGKAAYAVSWRTAGAGARAPHGHLVEFGHIQRYAVNLADDGNWYTLVRPAMRGKPRPKRGASQAVKDAYYVPRKGGPQQIAAKPFIRPAASKFPQAIAAAEAKLYEILGGRAWT